MEAVTGPAEGGGGGRAVPQMCKMNWSMGMANISFHLLRFIVLLSCARGVFVCVCMRVSKQTDGLYPKLDGLYI